MKSEPKVFENRKPKQKAFISGFLKVTIALSIIAVVALAKTVSADPTSMTTIVTESMALAIVLGTGIVFGIRSIAVFLGSSVLAVVFVKHCGIAV